MGYKELPYFICQTIQIKTTVQSPLGMNQGSHKDGCALGLNQRHELSHGSLIKFSFSKVYSNKQGESTGEGGLSGLLSSWNVVVGHGR